MLKQYNEEEEVKYLRWDNLSDFIMYCEYMQNEWLRYEALGYNDIELELCSSDGTPIKEFEMGFTIRGWRYKNAQNQTR